MWDFSCFYEELYSLSDGFPTMLSYIGFVPQRDFLVLPLCFFTDWRLAHTTYIYMSLILHCFGQSFAEVFLPRKMCGRIKIRSTNLWNFPFRSWRLIPFLWDGVSGEQIWCAFGEQATSTLAFCSPWEVILPCYKQLQEGVPWLRMEVSSYQWGKRAVCLQWSKGVWCSGQHLHLQLFEIS